MVRSSIPDAPTADLMGSDPRSSNGSDQKRLRFDPTDQTKLSYSLKSSKTGTNNSTDQLLIHDFTSEFYFDLAQDQTVYWTWSFQYQDRAVTTREELLNLPYSSGIRYEQEVFNHASSRFYRRLFLPKEVLYQVSSLYPFFLTNRSRLFSFVRKLPSLVNLFRSFIKWERLKLMLKPWQSTEIGLKVWIQLKWTRSPKLQAKDYFVSHTGKVLVFDEETKKISSALADLRAKNEQGWETVLAG